MRGFSHEAYQKRNQNCFAVVNKSESKRKSKKRHGLAARNSRNVDNTDC